MECITPLTITIKNSNISKKLTMLRENGVNISDLIHDLLEEFEEYQYLKDKIKD